jgi:hypothetical protein
MRSSLPWVIRLVAHFSCLPKGIFASRTPNRSAAHAATLVLAVMPAGGGTATAVRRVADLEQLREPVR